jgi:hypothetical protein
MEISFSEPEGWAVQESTFSRVGRLCHLIILLPYTTFFIYLLRPGVLQNPR